MRSLPSSPRPSLTHLFADTFSIDAPKNKRKAAPSDGSTTSTTRIGHFGLSNDSSASIALVTLSRLIQARDDDILLAASQTPIGASVLLLLRSTVLRVATSVGGADASFNEMTAASLWNLSASVVASQRLYDGGLSLPSKLPWPRARALVTALFESVNLARTTGLGARVGELLLRQPAPILDAAAQADIAALVEHVEMDMRARLGAVSYTHLTLPTILRV